MEQANEWSFELPTIEGAKANPRTIHISESVCEACQ